MVQDNGIEGPTDRHRAAWTAVVIAALALGTAVVGGMIFGLI